MDTAAQMKARHAAGLAQLAELGLALARDLAESALAAETPDEKAKLASAFHRLSRSVRQTYALEAKLSAEAAREKAAADRDAARARHDACVRRVRPTLVRLIWDEYEGADAEELEEDLDATLQAGLDEDDLAAPPDVLIARIAELLALKPPPIEAKAKVVEPP